MSAANTDLLTQATNNSRPSPTQVTSIRSGGGTTLQVNVLTGWPTSTAVHFITYKVDTSGNKIAGSQIDMKGVVSGTQITNILIKAGTDAGNSIGDIVEASPTAAWANDLYSWGIAQHSELGAHIGITNTGGLTTDTFTATSTLTLPNNSIAAANLATSAITLAEATYTIGNQTTTATTFAALTGLTINPTIPGGGRRVQITLFGDGAFNSGTNLTTFAIFSGATSGALTTQIAQTEAGSTTILIPVNCIARQTPAAGSIWYTAAWKVSGGTSTLNCSTTAPAFITAEAR